ncbi:MAG: hypothetical protein O3C60_06240 [Planctomycetota bacterium]|nr:hypothetical protein [Planctomycetota bacterium]
MNSTSDAAVSNAHRLLWAGFMAILAAGVAFGIRGGILDNWATEFGFSGKELGNIAGAGLTGACFGVIIGGVIADKVGYGVLVFAAFFLHILSAVVTFVATKGSGTPESVAIAYGYLYQGTFLFAIANGLMEAVANPLVAAAFPNNRTHYLNILHASWPAGLVLGSALCWVLDDVWGISWKYQLALYLIPTVIYGLMFFGQAMPKSEASKQGLSLGEMFGDVGLLGGLVICFLISLFAGDFLQSMVGPNATYVGYAIGGGLLVAIGLITKFSFGSILLFILFLAHAMVGAVELGTDGWIQNITGNILTSSEGKFLFVFTSIVMFALRFCAHFIEKNLGLSPIGILLVCAVLACVGLNMTSRVTTFSAALVALTVYGIGKTFFWPTMLAVASDRFPRTGAVAISIMGGIGMISGGMLGSPGLGYLKDRFAAEELQKADAAVYADYVSEKDSKFLFLPSVKSLDGTKLGDVATAVKADTASEAQQKVNAASIQSNRRTLVADSAIPATMAVIYLGLLLYFKTIGGYKPVSLS